MDCQLLRQKPGQFLFALKSERKSEEIRKTMKESCLSKRRKMNGLTAKGPEATMEAEEQEQDGNPAARHEEIVIDDRYRPSILTFQGREFTAEEIPSLLNQLQMSDIDIERMHLTIIGIRKIIEQLGISKTFDNKAPQSLISYLTKPEYPQLQYEASIIFMNITYECSETTSQMVTKGLIQAILSLLDSPHQPLVENAIVIIGNLSCENVMLRRDLINERALEKLAGIIKSNKLIDEAAWALANLCRGCPIPHHQSIPLAVETLIHLISSAKIHDKVTSGDCLWALSDNINSSYKYIEQMLYANLVPKLISHAKHPMHHIMMPSAKLLGNIAIGSTHEIKQLFKNQDFIPTLEHLLKNIKFNIRSQAIWIIANISAEQKFANLLIQCSELVDLLVYLFKTSTIDTRAELCEVFGNFAANCKEEVIGQFIESYGIIELFVESIRSDHNQLVQAALQNLIEFIEYGECCSATQNYVKAQLDQYRFHDLLVEMIEGPTEEIRNVAQEIQDKFYQQDLFDEQL